jgi:hypothetical protein
MERWQSKGKVGPYRGVLVPYYNEKGKRQGLQGAAIHPEGMVAIRMREYEDGGQLITYETVTPDGHHYRLREHRAPSERVGERGARTIAGRWLRSLIGGGEPLPGVQYLPW